MSALLEISEAHHAYAEVNFIDPTMGLATRTVAHITKDGVELPPSILNTVVAWSQLPRTRDTLASLQPFVAERLEQMEGEWFSYRPVGARIQAELDVPVVIDGAWTGLVGLADDRPRAWTVTEHRMTREVADLFATYWARLQAKKDLEDLVATKDRFIASVSHELRTPLTAVIGLASELAEHRAAFSAEEQDEFVRMIADQSREVGHIVEDLLVAARASETQLTVLAERISLSAEVREVLTQLPGALSLRVNGLLQPVDVFADPLRLRQIIRNLLTNAHRYGGDPIEVRVGNGSGQAFLQVVDHGPGIPESMRDQVFLAYRSAAEVPGRTASIGLGLTVSRQLARLMGGDVTYHYNGESVFELTLPVPSPAA
jgi:signal transduction histidine kinase